MNKRVLTIASVITVIILAAVGFIVTGNQSNKAAKSPTNVVSVRDKDTGAVINYYPNQNSEASSHGFVLLNGEELANYLGPGQYTTVSTQISALLGAKSGQEVSSSTAKVMPGSVHWDLQSDVLKAVIKQDSPSAQITVDIKLQGQGQALVTAE